MEEIERLKDRIELLEQKQINLTQLLISKDIFTQEEYDDELVEFQDALEEEESINDFYNKILGPLTDKEKQEVKKVFGNDMGARESVYKLAHAILSLVPKKPSKAMCRDEIIKSIKGSCKDEINLMIRILMYNALLFPYKKDHFITQK